MEYENYNPQVGDYFILRDDFVPEKYQLTEAEIISHEGGGVYRCKSLVDGGIFGFIIPGVHTVQTIRQKQMVLF